MVIDQTPKMLRRSKLPIVKAKVGPKISILIADEKVFELIPVKKEIKAEVSGLYIVGVKGIRGSLEAPTPKKKAFLPDSRKTKITTNKIKAGTHLLRCVPAFILQRKILRIFRLRLYR